MIAAAKLEVCVSPIANTLNIVRVCTSANTLHIVRVRVFALDTVGVYERQYKQNE